MDTAVALVEAYLHANGYLTAVEFPIIKEVEGGGYRSVTDIDILAVRLPGAGMIVPAADEKDVAQTKRLWDPDPRLIDAETDTWIDFIIGEVKEGKAELNRGAREKATVITAIRRFAFVSPKIANRLADELLRDGEARVQERLFRLRMFAFGGRRSDRERGATNVILLSQCLDYLVSIGHEYAAIRGTAQLKNPTINLLAILDKAGYLAAHPPRRSGRDHRPPAES